MRSKPTWLILLLVSLLVLPSHMRAQQEPASLPVPLVNALFADMVGSSEAARFHVGELPPEWPSELIPAKHGGVLGGSTHGRLGATAVFVQAEDAATSQKTFEAQLQSAGWRRPVLPGTNLGGFEGAGFRGFYCRDSVMAGVYATPRSGGGSFLRVHYALEGRNSLCNESARGPDRMPRLGMRLALPVLSHPAGVTVSGVNGGGGSDHVRSSMRLERTAITPSSLIEHYGKQIVAHGWEIGSALVTEGMATAVVSAPLQNGSTWRGTLTIVDAGDARHVILWMNAS